MADDQDLAEKLEEISENTQKEARLIEAEQREEVSDEDIKTKGVVESMVDKVVGID